MRKSHLLPLVLLTSLFAFAQQSRHFTFHYAFSVRNVQSGQKIEIWFPQASSGQFQEVKVVSVTSDLPLKTTRESKYGNTLFHAVAPKAARDSTVIKLPKVGWLAAYDLNRRTRCPTA